MNVTIPIEVSGDIWYNEQAVRQHLLHLPADTKITLDLRSEGPSLHRLGVVAVIDAWLVQHNLTPDCVTVTSWSNACESISYNKRQCSVPSHFWYYAQEYKLPSQPELDGINYRLFGLFLGRATVARNVILYQIQQHWTDRFLISRLPAITLQGTLVPEPWNFPYRSDLRLPETLTEWMPDQEQQVIDWFNTQTFSSIDSRTLRDQFGDPGNHVVHNSSLLLYYNQFNIELVCETYTLGQTFFPTEKTARPIAGTKPWIIYGAPGYIQHLKHMGFCSFDTLWDESYDQLEGPARWSAIKKVIQQLINLDTESLHSLLLQAHKIAQHNRLHLETIRP